MSSLSLFFSVSSQRFCNVLKMTKYILTVLFCCLGLLLKAQEASDVLLIVAGKMISSADFCSAYERNQRSADFSKEQIDGFLTQFINERLLVAEAEALRLDTLTEFRHRMSKFSSNNAESASLSSDWKKVYRGKPSVQIAHFTLPLRQRATYGEQQTLRARIDSVYNAILSGSDFVTTAAKISQGTVQVEWVGKNQLLADLESVAFRLNEGEMSAPILSTDGFHLMKCLKVGFQEDDAQPQSVAAPAHLESGFMNEYRSGLLIHLLHERKVMGKAEEDNSGMQQYFSENQKKYAWEIPHYKGVVYQCKNKKTQKLVKKLLSKQPQSQWLSLIENPDYEHVFKNARISPLTLFVLGENEQVDELAFGGPKAQADGEYPFYGILGKELKKYPDSYEDAGDMLIDDYQSHLEHLFLDGLKKRHEVAINEKALKRLYK